VLLNLQTAITQIQNTESGPDQTLVIWAHKAARWLQKHQVRVTIQWVPEHAEVEGNEQTDQAAKQAVARPPPPQNPGELLLAHMRKGLTETQTKKHQD
jgi:ribonuclease HI